MGLNFDTCEYSDLDKLHRFDYFRRLIVSYCYCSSSCTIGIHEQVYSITISDLFCDVNSSVAYCASISIHDYTIRNSTVIVATSSTIFEVYCSIFVSQFNDIHLSSSRYGRECYATCVTDNIS